VSIRQPQLQTSSAWGTNTSQAVNKGPVPTSFGSRLLAGGVRQFYITGAPYSGYVNFLSCPILPAPLGLLTLRFRLMIDEPASRLAQIFEFDSRLCLNKIGINLSSQLNVAEGGMWQINKVNGDWIDTGILVGKLAPYGQYDFELQYKFDFAKKLYSHLSVNWGTGPKPIPPTLQNLAATPLDWDDTCNAQVQLCTNSQGGSFSIVCDEMEYEWS
jgi:hypothetical protein